MTGRGGGAKKELDPEQLMKKKFRAKCLFRALGRLVMANAHWLIEDSENYEGLENVKRRVQQAMRGKPKKKQLLSINDKALLNKPANERTEQEKKYIYRIIGGLKCFKRYPNHVKKKLAAVTYFKYYGPCRTIVRQHQDAHALYFIVSGEVTVTQMVFDELLQQYVSIEIGVMQSGDLFGEVSLLHGIPRTATVTTVGHCELLALMKEDFKNVLQASVQKQWDEVKRAMSAFTYFDGLDEVARREGCIVAKMKSYEQNETLLGDGVGVANFVYFVLSGRCQMIESIQVVVTTRLGRDFYSLYDPYVCISLWGTGKQRSPSSSNPSLATKGSTSEITHRHSPLSFSPDLPRTFENYIPPDESEQDLDTKYFGAYNNRRESRDSVESTSQRKSIERKRTESILKNSSLSKQSKHSEGNKGESVQISVDAPEIIELSASTAVVPSTQENRILLDPTEQGRNSHRMSVIPEAIVEPLPQNLRTYFMQVCIFNPGSSFGFGENMRDRRIVALTPVDCMLLPKIWLLQRNTANIWTRIQHYLDKKIPTKKDLFKQFVEDRRWQEFRDQMVDDVVSRSNTVNWTSVHDVPYSIRMEEMLDI